MKQTRAVLFFAVVVGMGVALAAQGPRLRGFTPAAAERQLRLEEQFKAIPSPEEARKHHRFFTAAPHPAGSQRNNELAEHIAALWRQQGWEEVKVHRYDVLQSVPRQVELEVVAPIRYRASLREDPYDHEPDTRHPDISPGYLSLSASGEVTAPVVYAYSGNPEDYDLLRRYGIVVRGKIVLVRYSSPYSYRGFKALTAQRMGAAGLLIYSDPAEDGYKRGMVYPDGPWGPESHIQRGAITYDFFVAGDPLTPGWAALPDARRIPIEEAVSVPRILALPLSWRDAKPLLENLGGPVAPKRWQGGLPITYRLGGQALQARMKVDLDTRPMPNFVVEAHLRGSDFPDEWVVLGNHRDAWEFGGVDPSSGTASLVELTRALGELKKQGFRPRRTIVVCSWDGEEVALTGSTEWGEHFAEEIKRKAVAYLNVDSSTSGPEFNPAAVPSLAEMIVEVSRMLEAPSGKLLYEEWQAHAARTRKKPRVADAELVNTRIGSGSDHTVFLSHLGVSSILLEFDGPYGVYHSIYDNHDWMSRFGDPGFRYHALMSRLWGVLALRLANADLLPFDFASYARSVRGFVHELERASSLRGKLDLRSLHLALSELEVAGHELNASREAALASGHWDVPMSAAINPAALQFERNWLHPEGIPGRPWFKHLLYAARYTYAHLELPGLTEAVERGDWKLAGEQARLLEAAARKNAALLRRMRAELLPSAAGAAKR